MHKCICLLIKFSQKSKKKNKKSLNNAIAFGMKHYLVKAIHIKKPHISYIKSAPETYFQRPGFI